MRCASCVPHPVRRTKKCCGKHAELIPGAKYVLRPGGTSEYHQTTQQYPRFLQTCCGGATGHLRPTGNRIEAKPPRQSFVYKWEIGPRRLRPAALSRGPPVT